jgi:translocation and assembly module TamA
MLIKGHIPIACAMKLYLQIGLLLSGLGLSALAWGVEVTVRLEGLDNGLRAHVLTYLDIARQEGQQKLSAARVQRLHEQAPRQIRKALQVFGFYQASVQPELQRDGDTWHAVYKVDPGKPVRIESLQLSITGDGRDNTALKAAAKNFPIRKGQALNQPDYDNARDALFRTAIEQGYLDAQFSRREVRVDLSNYSVSVILALQTGARYFFGPVSFNQSEMDQKFLRRFIHFQPGEAYSPAKLLQLQTALSDSSLFGSVDVSAEKTRAVDNRVPITINLSPRKRTQWRFGLGYATDTGPRGSVNYNHIVGKEGHTFESKLLVSKTIRSISAGYAVPLGDPVKEQMSYRARYSDEVVENRESLISGIGASYTASVGDWQRVISLNYDREVYKIPGESEQTGRALYPVYSLSRISADNRIYTRDGYRIYFEVRGANKNLLSDTNYAQVRTGLKYIYSLNNDSRVLLRGDFGSTNVAYLSDMPLSQRFFAGGDNSVRGYASNELGPKDAFGNVVGGKHLIVGSVEYEHRLYGNWSTALFYDVGNAVNSMSDPLVAGAGFGIRWNSPVGPVRFDFAWALDKPTDRFRLHVVIGPDL